MAVVLSGYNCDARLTGNTFYLLGGSAVVLWGHETNGDGTDGNQPRRTTVSENFCHGQPASKLRRPRLRSTGMIVSRVLRAEIGIYQKQSSCYFHAVSAQSTVTNNLFFNGPRAMVRLLSACFVQSLFTRTVYTTSGRSPQLGSDECCPACRPHVTATV